LFFTPLLGLFGLGYLPQVSADYVRPYGPTAPWNIPVNGLKRHAQSDYFGGLLWNDAPSARPGNFNLSFDEYTYPVYDAREATGLYPVRTTSNSNINGGTIPWNPAWKPAPGSDAQAIVLDPATGREWNLWQTAFDGTTIHASNGSLVPGSYFTRTDGWRPSRGVGIQYLAMLVRPEEIAQGRIEHALSMPIRNTSGEFFVAPATKLEHPGRGPGIPEGMRFALDVTDAQIAAWLDSMPAGVSQQTRNSARIIAEALRNYGWFITDTSGGAHFQFEAMVSAGNEWTALGLGPGAQDLLDGLITRDRIYAIVPSDKYPTVSAAPVPVPPAVWSFGSALVFLSRLGRRRK
jgi:hypothetical protein